MLSDFPESVTPACRDLPPDQAAYFTGGKAEQAYAAGRYCAVCPAMKLCLYKALSLPRDATRNAVWGGLTPAQREHVLNGREIAWPRPLPAAR